MNRQRKNGVDSSLTTLGREFGSSVGSLLSAKGIGYRILAARLRNLESVYVRRLGRNKRLAREIRRRVAETLLKEAICRGCSFEDCRKRMKSLSRLGFITNQSKSTHLLIYAETDLC